MKISIGNNRKDVHWKNKEESWEELLDRFKVTRRTAESVADYRKLKKSEQDDIKDVGGFVGGHIRLGRRKKGNIMCRSMLTLDMDFCHSGIVDELEMLFCNKAAIYSTHKHTPEAPRLRLIIPLDREVTAEEYVPIARKVAEEIGIEMFDDSTYEPSRLMYFPSTSSDGEFVFRELEGEPLKAAEYLAKYKDWHDVSSYPVSSRQTEEVQHAVKQQADPLEKLGIVGAFCRTYSIPEVIEVFLADVYAPSSIIGRYDYINGEGHAGVVVYEDKYAYSHHGTDPAGGKLLNAFDLVRIHKFGDLDDEVGSKQGSTLPSFKAMADLASNDEKVKMQIVNERLQEAGEDFGDGEWKKHLVYEKRSTELKNCVENLMLILQNDENLQGFAYNELANKVQVTGILPWDRPKENRYWRDADTAHLKVYLDTHYGVFSTRNHDTCFAKVADQRRFHPVVKYLEALPPWDKVERVEQLLIDYLNAEDNVYNRSVIRKTLVAAVARAFKPGTKFDSVLILNGPQGIGKSTFFSRLGGEWFSDSLSLTDMKDKAAAEKLQGFWIMEMGELAGMKKADIESVKSFISRTDDDYRASYGRAVESHLRQCIIVGSTNADSGFLRDITGNRRFWPVQVRDKAAKKPWMLTASEVDQVWAEALELYKLGEVLCLEGQAADMAIEAQSRAMETDERQGMIEQYLSVLLPDNWDDLSLYERRDYICNPDGLVAKKGTNRRRTVSNAEIWCECFCKDFSVMKPSDSYAIAGIMAKIEGWERSEKSVRNKLYGKQRVYVRV